MSDKPIFQVYEVFTQKDHSSPHVWVGSVDAGSPDDALLMARENFLRRDPAVSIWVVRQQDVHRTSYEDKDFFAPLGQKKYRLLGSYAKVNNEKWRKYMKSILDVEKDFVRD